MASRSKKRSSNSSASPSQRKQLIQYPSASAKNILHAKSWAAYSLADSLSQDILQDLRNVFPRKSADSFYALSLMLAANPNLKLDDVQNATISPFLPTGLETGIFPVLHSQSC